MDAIALLESLAITSVPSPRSHDHPGATAHLSGAKERRSIGTVAASANRVMYLTSNYRGMDLWTGGELRSTLSKRHGVLASVAESPKTKPELVAALDQSRSTIDRAVTELSTVDCIEPRHDDRSQYRCTQTGRLALETYREYCADATLLVLCQSSIVGYRRRSLIRASSEVKRHSISVSAAFSDCSHAATS